MRSCDPCGLIRPRLVITWAWYRWRSNRGANVRIVLASESVFRHRAMDLVGLAYETCPATIDEKAIRDADPAELTRKLAEAKARKVAAERPDAVIVVGDAVVANGAKLYEKPRNLDEAAQFVRELSGSGFQFVTSLAVLDSPTGESCQRLRRP